MPRQPPMSIDLDALPRQLRYWTGHCLLNALPSVTVACVHLKYWKRVETLVAMGWAIVAFIFLFSFLTSIRGPLTQSDHTLNRALRAGVKFRMTVSLISLPLLVPPLIVLVPDLWCGLLATWVIHLVEHLSGNPHNFAANLSRLTDKPTFTEVFAMAMISGALISLLMFMVSFFAVLVIQRRERARMYRIIRHAN